MRKRKVWIDDIFGLPRWTVFIVLVMFCLGGWLFGYIRALNYSFNGVIQKIEYSKLQKTPTITINGKDYDLVDNNWFNYKDTLAVGDSAIKKKGETGFTLIKKKK